MVLGIRAHDAHRLDLQAAGIIHRPVPVLRAEGAPRSAQWAREQLTDCVGYWVHVDVDVLDPSVLPAVDSPEPGGIAFGELELLLAGLVDTPHCLGMQLTVFDPDYDPDGAYAAEIVSTVVAGLAPVTDVVDAAAARAAELDSIGRGQRGLVTASGRPARGALQCRRRAAGGGTGDRELDDPDAAPSSPDSWPPMASAAGGRAARWRAWTVVNSDITPDGAARASQRQAITAAWAAWEAEIVIGRA